MKKVYLIFVGLIVSLSTSAADCTPVIEVLNEQGFKVQILSYKQTQNKNHILIVPPTGGTNFLDRNWGEDFCEEGFTAHIIEHWTDDDEYKLDLGIHQRLYSRAQRAIGAVIKNLKDASFIGIMGTSIGGIHAASGMGLHERINAAFVITAGADLPSIIANSDQKVLVDAWNTRRLQLKIPDKPTYIRMLSEAIQYDPLKLSNKFQGKDLGMIITSGDKTVPYENQIKLKNFWKPKTVMNYSLNHFWTIFYSRFFDSDDVIDFFKNSAKKKGPKAL